VQARARVLRLEDFRRLSKEEVYWSREQRFNVFRGSKAVISGQWLVASDLHGRKMRTTGLKPTLMVRSLRGAEKRCSSAVFNWPLATERRPLLQLIP